MPRFSLPLMLSGSVLGAGLGLVLALAPAGALPMPLTPAQALGHEGECVSVEGRAQVINDEERAGLDVVLGRASRAGYADQFEGFIPYEDEAVYPRLRALDGQLVDITGVIQFHHSLAEIKMTEPHQLIAAPPADRPRPQILC